MISAGRHDVDHAEGHVAGVGARQGAGRLRHALQPHRAPEERLPLDLEKPSKRLLKKKNKLDKLVKL